jgi:hypothetical protein
MEAPFLPSYYITKINYKTTRYNIILYVMPQNNTQATTMGVQPKNVNQS